MVWFCNLLILLCFSLEGTQWKEAIADLPPYPGNKFQGRGIVIPAGGEAYLVNAYVNLCMLRHAGCALPVEIWYIGEEEIVPNLMKKIEELGAICCDITDYYDYPIRGWEVKPHAIVASRFEEVLLLDADNVVLSDPEFLFETQEYLETGALFWPDIQVLEEKNPLWEVLELEPRCVQAQESGQLLIDKSKCWLALQLCVHMNKESAFYYQHIFGDKDTYLLSFLTTKTSFTMIPHLPGLVFKARRVMPYSSFLQRDLLGEPLFCHMVLKNWAERRNLKPIWKTFTLPEQDGIFSFRKKFGDFERVCIEYFKPLSRLTKRQIQN